MRFRFLSGVILGLLLLLVQPLESLAAEVLQVRSATLLQVGDRNRNYTVQLACVDVAVEDQQRAQDWLRAELPRRRRVNLRPEGSADGVLIARVTPLGDELDLGAVLIQQGLAQSTCSEA